MDEYEYKAPERQPIAHTRRKLCAHSLQDINSWKYTYENIDTHSHCHVVRLSNLHLDPPADIDPAPYSDRYTEYPANKYTDPPADEYRGTDTHASTYQYSQGYKYTSSHAHIEAYKYSEVSNQHSRSSTA